MAVIEVSVVEFGPGRWQLMANALISVKDAQLFYSSNTGVKNSLSEL